MNAYYVLRTGLNPLYIVSFSLHSKPMTEASLLFKVRCLRSCNIESLARSCLPASNPGSTTSQPLIFILSFNPHNNSVDYFPSDLKIEVFKGEIIFPNHMIRLEFSSAFKISEEHLYFFHLFL